MRRAIALAVLVVGSLVMTLIFTPTPDALSMAFMAGGFLTLGGVGYGLGLWSATRRRAAPNATQGAAPDRLGK